MAAQVDDYAKLVGSPYSEDSARPFLVEQLRPYLEFERWLDGPDNDDDNELEDDGSPLPEGERVVRYRLSSESPVVDDEGRRVYTYEYVTRSDANG